MEQSVLKQSVKSDTKRWVDAIVKLTTLTYQGKLKWVKEVSPPSVATEKLAPRSTYEAMLGASLPHRVASGTHSVEFSGNSYYLTAFVPFSAAFSIAQLTGMPGHEVRPELALRVVGPGGGKVVEFPNLSVLQGLYDAVQSQTAGPEEAILRSIEEA